MTQPIRELMYCNPEEIIVGVRIREDMGDIDGLAGSIKERGLLCPILILKDRTLICGSRRLAAC